MTQIIVENDIKIEGLLIANKLAIKKSLTLPNLEYEKMRRMGVWAVREFKFFSEQGEMLIIPRGCYIRLKKYLATSNIEAEWIVKLIEIPCSQGKSTVVLREYQKEIVDSIVGNLPSEGIIVSSTGSGKTIIALEIIHRLGLSSTILVTNTVLSDQFEGEARLLYSLVPSIINATSKEVGNLTISTFQSLFDNPSLLQRLADNTSVLVLDEVQGCVSKERRKVLSYFKPKHLFGLTATPSRSDSLSPAIEFLCGQPLANYEMEQAQPTVEVIRTDVEIPIIDSYPRIIDAMIANESRNKLICGLAIGEAMTGRKVLVLTKRRLHYENFKHILPDFSGIFFIDSDDEERNTLLAEFKKEERPFSIIFGTTSLLSVGVDVPSLDTLIIACDIKSSVLTTQSVGRILRLFKDKKDPKIYDLRDNKNPILNRQFYERRKLYISKKWKLIE